MADSIIKLRVASEEFDAKIKRAAEGVKGIVNECHKAGSVLNVLEKENREYIESLGNMSTVSNTARGKVNELSKAFTDLRALYNSLSQEEKNGEFGKELNKQLDIMKTRIQDGTKELKNIKDEMTGSGGLTGALDNLAGKFGMNIQQLAGWGAALAAAKGALDVAKDAFFASEANVDEWGRTVAASESLYQSFLTSLNNTDISGFLSRIDEIVTAARKAYDELDRLGTMKTIQAPAISAQQTENERMRMMIQTGRYIAPMDGRAPAAGMKNGQLLTADQIRNIEKHLQNGMNNVVKLVGNEVKQTSKAIDAVYNRQAKELGMSIKEFRKGTSSMEEFDKRVAGAQAYNKYESEHTSMQYDAGQGRYVQKRDRTANPYEAYKGWDVFRVDGDRYKQLVQLIQQRDQQTGQAYSMQSQAYRTINRAEGTTVRSILNGGAGSGSGSGGKGGSTTTSPADEVAKAEKEYADTISNAKVKLDESVIKQEEHDKAVLDGQKKLGEAYLKAYNATGDEKYLNAFGDTANKINEMQGVVDSNIEAQKAAEQSARELERAQRKQAEALDSMKTASAEGNLGEYYKAQKQYQKAGGTGTGGVDVPVNITAGNLDAFTAHIKEEIGKTDLADPMMKTLEENMSDATAISTIMQTAIKNGIDTAQFDTSGLMQKLLNSEDISDDTIQAYVDQLNNLLKEKFDETEWPQVAITFNVKSKEIENLAKSQQKDAQKMAKEWQAAGQAISAVGNAMNQIEDPAAKVLGTIAQAVATMMLSYSQAATQAASMGPWAWIAFAATGLATAITSVNAIKNATENHANGGFIGGNSYSGDNMLASGPDGKLIGLNAGELILNKSQQNNLANALENEGGGGGTSQPYVTGEMIYLGLNNYLKANGYGEIVTSNS